MADEKIVIWPIGAEAPYMSDEPFELKQYLHSQRQAWMDLNNAFPNDNKLRAYLDENLKRINSFDSILQQLHSPYGNHDEQARHILWAATRSKEGMWIDASSATGQNLILDLGANNLNRFRENEKEAHADWARRIRKWDATAGKSSGKENKTIGPGNAALAKALLGESPTIENAVASAEAKIRKYVELSQQEFSRFTAIARDSSNKDHKASVEAASGAIANMVVTATSAIRTAQVDATEKVSQSQIKQVQIVEQLSPKIDGFEKRLNELTSGLETKMREIPKIESELVRMTSQVSEKIEGAEAAIKAHENAHREQLKLRSPTTYWLEREAKHALRSNLALGTFVVIVGVSAFAMWFNFDSIWTNLKDIQNSPNSGALNLTGLAIVTMPSVAFFWILKHVSRIFVENSALAADAGQRSVMMMTYLALIGDPAAKVDERERLLVLNALFRPSATGGSDDAPPSNLLDILMKVSEKK